MELQKIIEDLIKAHRAEEMKNSRQLTIEELILKLHSVTNKELPVYFDEEQYRPTGLGSWRGSYCEIAIQYKDGGEECYEQMKDDCKRDQFGYHDYDCPCGGSNTHSTTLKENPTVQDLLDVFEIAKGKYFIGYKGGDFTMGKTTPIWVANYGNSSGFKQEEDRYDHQGVMGIEEKDDRIIIVTEAIKY